MPKKGWCVVVQKWLSSPSDSDTTPDPPTPTHLDKLLVPRWVHLGPLPAQDLPLVGVVSDEGRVPPEHGPENVPHAVDVEFLREQLRFVLSINKQANTARGGTSQCPPEPIGGKADLRPNGQGPMIVESGNHHNTETTTTITCSTTKGMAVFHHHHHPPPRRTPPASATPRSPC